MLRTLFLKCKSDISFALVFTRLFFSSVENVSVLNCVYNSSSIYKFPSKREFMGRQEGGRLGCKPVIVKTATISRQFGTKVRAQLKRNSSVEANCRVHTSSVLTSTCWLSISLVDRHSERSVWSNITPAYLDAIREHVRDCRNTRLS